MSNARNLARLLPNASGQLPDAAMASGSVLQVVNANQKTPTSTTSTSYVATPLQATITPLSTTSKIFVIYSCQMHCGVSGVDFVLGVAKNGSVIFPDTSKANGSSSFNVTMSACVFDSPATSTAVTYAVYMRSLNGATITFNVDNYSTNITLVEIAG